MYCHRGTADVVKFLDKTTGKTREETFIFSMGNKRKNRERKEERSIANREAYNRMNFLYQVYKSYIH